MLQLKNNPSAYSETIVAQCTPVGSGALALLRISGPEACIVASRCARLSSGLSLTDTATHTIHHGWVIDRHNQKLDEVLFFVMYAPRTFTGEHTIEITCHNNQFIIESIIQELITHGGARLAQPGEFTRYAVENNKLDLLQAEAINDLIHANNQQALKIAFSQVAGSLSEQISLLEKEVLESIAFCEASFEFLDEEVDFASFLHNKFVILLDTIACLKNNFNHQKLIRQGLRIALIGSVNAGKSSLFNRLVGSKRSIVTPIAGTTRDVIEAGIYQKDGTFWTFIDTAGLRETNNIIELEGIERSKQEASIADLILLVIDGSRKTTSQEEQLYHNLLNSYKDKTIVIANKSDLPHQAQPLTLHIALSTYTNTGIEALQETLTHRSKQLFEKTDCPFLLTRRQATLLLSFEQEIQTAYLFLQRTPIAYELIAHHIKNGLALLTELTGKSINEKALDVVFKEFCVGK